MVKGSKVSPENVLEQFSHRTSVKVPSSRIGTSQLSDAMRKVVGENGVLQGLKPIQSGLKISGPATTVYTSADDWGTVIKGIYTAKKGNILVISCDNDATAVWGELASTAAKIQGLEGTVIFGSSRDLNGINNLGYPVFSRDIIPNAGNPLAHGEINIPVMCGDVTVNPGDFIMGDDCGVVRVPKDILENVIKEAYRIIRNEDDILNQLNHDKSFLDILKL